MNGSIGKRTWEMGCSEPFKRMADVRWQMGVN